MSTLELPKAYDPTEVEPRWYAFWEGEGFFRADPAAAGEPFVIILPPPNVTGSLHIGHALTATIEDLLIRWRRMQGRNTLWLPGTDHAGIATQIVVERELAKEQLTRHDLGRERFVERVWEWKERYGNRITEQHKALGASLDWSRERFTMDPGSSNAVREVFVRLHEEGLCHRAERLINWCPRCHTALSDLEVDHEENVQGELFSFAYPLADGSGEIVVATTRPETMLGDTAVAVHPEDPRYRPLLGKMLRHPLLEREIPVVGDDVLVDPEFGTGAVKVTPAHDFNDFACGQRHGLPMINILRDDGTLNENAGPFAGQDRFAARAAVKEALVERGLGRGEKPHLLALGRCHRCDTVVEPYLSKQWFVDAETLARPAIAAVESGRTRFVPETWTKTFFHWMHNIQPWCVSRQLWWGHRIPAWYCGSDHVTVARETPSACSECGSTELRQDEDVLDTWFSSALWPFSTLGWPEATEDLRRYYPNTVMETGFDIIFFWVARMMMMGHHFMGEPPFATVFMHAMVRDEKGQKMSKTRGNVVDPLDISERFGADSLRFTLAILAAQGRDIKLSLERVEGYRNFLNKLWNASRFALLNLADYQDPEPEAPWGELSLADRWIHSRLATAAARANAALEEYRFNEAAGALYSFVWHELCDWYIELCKPNLYADADPAARRAAQRTLVHTLEATLRLLHPFIPFITEEIWQKLPVRRPSPSVMVSRYPEAPNLPLGVDEGAERDLGFLMEVITALRTIRTETGIPPGKPVAATILAHAPEALSLLEEHRDYVARLARIEPLDLRLEGERPRGAAAAVVRGTEVLVPLGGVVDLDAERQRLEKEIGKLQQDRAGAEKRLANPKFVERAPAEVVEKERGKLEEITEKLGKLEASLQRLREIEA